MPALPSACEVQSNHDIRISRRHHVQRVRSLSLDTQVRTGSHRLTQWLVRRYHLVVRSGLFIKWTSSLRDVLAPTEAALQPAGEVARALATTDAQTARRPAARCGQREAQASDHDSWQSARDQHDTAFESERATRGASESSRFVRVEGIRVRSLRCVCDVCHLPRDKPVIIQFYPSSVGRTGDMTTTTQQPDEWTAPRAPDERSVHTEE